MPPRFVEVLDVASEASSMLSQLSSRAAVLASDVTFNISSYINVSTREYDVNLLAFLAERYNISTEDVVHTLSTFNLTNTNISHVTPPSGLPGWLIGTGLVILTVRGLLVHRQAIQYVNRFGHTQHSHAD